ncbi:MAG: hypothetical protein KIT84_10325 [Labilithrix sp.]|nr:hypothetical protein [Labilithrix sp.]MCW5811400.1 hypothetical protein [Labilithrix sp.]
MHLARALPFAALLVACSESPTTPPGLLGEVDLRSQLPAGVAVPAESALESHEMTKSICGFESYPPAEIKVRWKSFRDGESAYIASYAVEVTQSGKALAVSLGKDALVGSELLMPGVKTYRAIATLWVQCTRKTFRLDQQGGEMIQFRAGEK